MSIEYTLYLEPPLLEPELSVALEKAGFELRPSGKTFATVDCFAEPGVALDPYGAKEDTFGFDPGSRVSFWLNGQGSYRTGMRDLARGVRAAMSELPEADLAFVHEPGTVVLTRVGGVLTVSDRDGWFTNEAEGFSTILPEPDRIERLPVI